MVDRVRRAPREVVEEFTQKEESPPKKEPKGLVPVLSTGSTLLDLAVYGGVQRGGGIPGGIIAELFGESSLGKTAILCEVCASSQSKGGDVVFNDPEARLDRDYAEIYGMSLKGENYRRSGYVDDFFADIRGWTPPRSDVINVYGGDSLAALTTKLEMEKGDKMGMRRAKEMSAGLRIICRDIAVGHKTIVLTNQVRQGDHGLVTPGGKGIPFYSSMRIQIMPMSNKAKLFPPKIEREISVGAKSRKVTKTIGINSMCRVVKSSKDDPWREVPISIVFGYGVDDVHANLQWFKIMTGETTYQGGFQSMDDAIRYIEDDNLEEDLREGVIDLWEEIEAKFKKGKERKKKTR